MSLTWDTRKLLRDVTTKAARGVDEAADFLTEEIRDLISIQGFPYQRRSKPGEPPRVDTTTLHRSIDHKVLDKAGVRQAVGSLSPPVSYAVDLEYGVGFFTAGEQRPFLRVSLARHGRTCGKMILGAMA
mgnify:CR=1 FL=1